jgi:hypothetical protein
MAVDTFDYLESRDDADEMIQEFGAAASVRRVTSSGTDYAPTLTPTDYPTFAARVEFTWKQMQGGNVLENDERWLVAAGPLNALGVTALLPGDAIVVGAVVKSVLKANTLAPAGTVVLFDCHIRV